MENDHAEENCTLDPSCKRVEELKTLLKEPHEGREKDENDLREMHIENIS